MRGSSAIRIALLSVLLAGCGILDEGDPTQARVVLQGSVPEPITLVTSNTFLVIRNLDTDRNEIQLIAADTAAVSPPFEASYPLGSGTRFYVLLYAPEGVSGTVTLQVFIDDVQFYSRTADIGLAPMEFIYTFR